MDPKNPLPEETFSHWYVGYSSYVETPVAESELEDLWERLRRYHEPSQSPSPVFDGKGSSKIDPKTVTKPQTCSSLPSSSSGSTIAPMSPKNDDFGDYGYDLVVEDTPERPGYIPYDLGSARRCNTRRSLNRVAFSTDEAPSLKDYDSDETQEPDNWAQFKKENPQFFHNRADPNSPYYVP